MFRVLAVLFVLYGCIGFSFKLCQEMRIRISHVEQMKQILQLFQSEISYSRTSFPEMCYSIAKRVDGVYGQVLSKIYEQTQQQSGMLFPDIWKEKMKQALAPFPLKEKERTLFLEFVDQLGFADWEMQVRSIAKSTEQLADLEAQLKGARHNKEKVITSVGVLGGIMLVIIFI